MKLKEGFILREVAGQIIVLSDYAKVDLNAMITLNETGKFLWERLEKDCTQEELVSAIMTEYDVDEATATNSVARFVGKLEKNGFLE